jgi:NAD+ diphosphatase
MSSPTRSLTFVSGIALPEDHDPHQAIWFVFQGDQLLVRVADETMDLPTWADLPDLGEAHANRHFLGRLGDTPVYTVELPLDAALPGASGALRLERLRPLWGRLPDPYFGLAGRAAQIVEWDRTHRFCGRCGTPTERQPAERARRCPSCGLLSFPRLSPAIIVLVRRDDSILLVHGRNAPANWFTNVAGFVEPGETLEETVAREVMEEVGIEITDIHYFGSQPWPYPHQLMVGFTARYAAGELRPDGDEIVEAHWFPLDGLPTVPPPMTISRWLIDSARQP